MGFFRFIIFKSNGPHCNKKKIFIFSRQQSCIHKDQTKIKTNYKIINQDVSGLADLKKWENFWIS